MTTPTWGEPGYQPPPTPDRPRRGKGRKTLLILGGVIAGLFAIGLLAGDPKPTTTTVAPSSAAPTTAASLTTKQPVTTKPIAAPTTAKPKPVRYRNISARQWALIAKSPDAHDSEHIIVYGQVTQFDGATGPDQFLADVDGVVHPKEYGYVDYEVNTLLYGDESALTDLVEGDLFTARVRVAGSASYDTQIGGNTTVPKLQITSIKVTGSAK